ncbi:hypothetical protein PWT90_07135 [Aphanocladium album]|nr:hypothetical protein PWT90_07135 [Aphanocladium album]
MPKRSQIHRPQPNAEHRRRVYAACSECRRRRRKCDGNRPCAQCQAYGYGCAYDAENSSPQSSSEAVNASRSMETVVQRRQNRAARSASADVDDEAAAAAVTPSKLIVNRERGRFVNANSAIALPHLVGQELSAAQPLRLHSFAWNLGLRPERRGALATSLSHFLTLTDCQALSAVYFDAVHPLFAFLDPESFSRRLVQHWSTLESQPNFTAVVAMVAVLGSFFSPPARTHLREDDIKRHGLAILDFALTNPTAVDMDSVAGWILRTLYMRLTTRPAISCMASHTAMHFSEIVGLHRDVVDDATATANPAAFSNEELEARRRYFCTARFLNQLLTTEYGVSGVAPRHSNSIPAASVPGAHIEALYTMTAVLKDVEAAATAGLDSDEFTDLFRRLQDIPQANDTVSLFTADVCVALLRRFAAASSKPGPKITTTAAAILQQALASIANLLVAERTWWNMLSVPFQVICISASADSIGLLSLLPTAMELLRTMADKFGTHMVKEALATAQQVVTASRGCTDAKRAMKDAALTHAPPAADIDWSSFDTGFDMGAGEWPPVVDFFT